MFKKYFLLLILILSTPAFAISITGGQGYGVFRLSGTGSYNVGSIMYAGIKFNKYFEFKYSSVDTAIRMPVLPFRIVDVKYHDRTENGSNKYTSYDSDVFGLDVTLPFSKYVSFSALYGIGRGETTEVTEATGTDDTATIHSGIIHVVDLQLKGDITVWDKINITPRIGAMMHFLDDKSAYNNVLCIYAAASISYEL